MKYILFVRALLVTSFCRGHEIGTFNDYLLVKFYLTGLDYEKLVQWEVFLGHDHLSFFTLAYHNFRSRELQALVRYFQEHVDLSQKDDHSADFFLPCFSQKLLKTIKFNLEENQIVVAAAVINLTVTLHIGESVSELIIDDDLIQGQVQEVFVLHRLPLFVAVIRNHWLNQSLVQNSDD